MITRRQANATVRGKWLRPIHTAKDEIDPTGGVRYIEGGEVRSLHSYHGRKENNLRGHETSHIFPAPADQRIKSQLNLRRAFSIIYLGGFKLHVRLEC